MSVVAPPTPPAPPHAPPGTQKRFNRRAFGRIDATNALLQLYCTLVAIELALKDDGVGAGGGHDIIKTAKRLGDPNIDIAADLLNNTLKVLQCTQPSGVQGPVRPNAYPDTRYLHHDSDFSAGTSQPDLDAARDAVRALHRELDRYWRSLNKPAVIP